MLNIQQQRFKDFNSWHCVYFLSGSKFLSRGPLASTSNDAIVKTSSKSPLCVHQINLMICRTSSRLSLVARSSADKSVPEATTHNVVTTSTTKNISQSVRMNHTETHVREMLPFRALDYTNGYTMPSASLGSRCFHLQPWHTFCILLVCTSSSLGFKLFKSLRDPLMAAFSVRESILFTFHKI